MNPDHPLGSFCDYTRSRAGYVPDVTYRRTSAARQRSPPGRGLPRRHGGKRYGQAAIATRLGDKLARRNQDHRCTNGLHHEIIGRCLDSLQILTVWPSDLCGVRSVDGRRRGFAAAAAVGAQGQVGARGQAGRELDRAHQRCGRRWARASFDAIDGTHQTGELGTLSKWEMKKILSSACQDRRTHPASTARCGRRLASTSIPRWRPRYTPLAELNTRVPTRKPGALINDVLGQWARHRRTPEARRVHRARSRSPYRQRCSVRVENQRRVRKPHSALYLQSVLQVLQGLRLSA